MSEATRAEALRLAVSFAKDGETADLVVQNAEKFEKFLDEDYLSEEILEVDQAVTLWFDNYPDKENPNEHDLRLLAAVDRYMQKLRTGPAK